MDEPLSQELLSLLGNDDFFTLVDTVGGQRFYVPSNFLQLLEKLAVSPEGATLLTNRYGGATLRIPLARDFIAATLKSRKYSNAEIAAHLRITESGVEKLFKRCKRQGADNPFIQNQLDLFV